MFNLTLLHVVYSGCERTQVLVLSCLAVVFHLENHFEASQEGGARVYLQFQDSDVRHLDVEREFCVPARIEPIIFDWLRRWLRVTLEVFVVTSQDHLGNYNFRLLYNVDDLAFKIGLRLYQKDLDVWVDNIIVNIKLSAATSWKVLTRDHLAYD